MLNLSWVKCGDDKHWCSLERIILSNVDTIGIYIIWHGGNPSHIVRVGQGDIADRLSEHRENKDITKYSEYGTLYVTWAFVAPRYLDGVERYLAETWNPLVGERFPDVDAIAVNSPWK